MQIRSSMSPKVLVVYYSRTETTRRLGEAIAHALGDCDIERIRDTVRRDGIFGYLRSGRQAFFRQEVELLPLVHDPAKYDVVVVGTPIWNVSVSAPIRTFLARERNRLKACAFFLTCEHTGERRVFLQMQSLVGRTPLVRLAVRRGQLASDHVKAEVRRFAEAIRASEPESLARAAGTIAVTEDRSGRGS